MRLPRPLVRAAATAVHRLRRLGWSLGRPRGPGVHAVAVTPGGEVVLVRLTYAPGWRLPGGGRRRGEAKEAAVLRELQEEIGLTAHGAVRADARSDDSDYFIVERVEFDWKQTLEIEEVRCFDRRALPKDMPETDRRLIAELLE